MQIHEQIKDLAVLLAEVRTDVKHQKEAIDHLCDTLPLLSKRVSILENERARLLGFAAGCSLIGGLVWRVAEKLLF